MIPSHDNYVPGIEVMQTLICSMEGLVTAGLPGCFCRPERMPVCGTPGRGAESQRVPASERVAMVRITSIQNR